MSERRFRRTPAGAWLLGLHLLWCPKHRRRTLGGRGTRRSDEPSKLIADAHGWRVVDTELMPDHEHLFVRVGPTDAPVLVVPAFKCRTARVLGQEFPHRRNHTKVLWSPSDFVASVVDESEPTVYCYVEYQWHAVAP